MPIIRGIGKENVVHIYIIQPLKEWNNAICINTNWHRNSHTKWSNQTKTNIIWYIYIWNLKNDANKDLVVQWLRFHAPNTGGGDVGLISDWGSKTPCAMQHSQKKGKKSTNEHTHKKKQIYRLQNELKIIKEERWSVCVLSQSQSFSHVQLSLPGSFAHGIYWARILEWVAIPFSRGYPWHSDWTRFLTAQLDSLPSESPVALRKDRGRDKLWVWY